MMHGKKHATGRARRKLRVRKKVFGTTLRPRLSVFRSAKHLYAQVIDDTTGHTLAAAGTAGAVGSAVAQMSDSVAVRGGGKKMQQAQGIGMRIAQVCKEKNIEAVVFDRNGFDYHGRVRAVAEAARAGGLKF